MWLRSVAVISVLVLLTDMLVRNVLPHYPQVGMDQYVDVVVDELLLEWISLVAWPVIPLMGLTLWVAPFVKQRRQQTRAFAVLSCCSWSVGSLMQPGAWCLLSR